MSCPAPATRPSTGCTGCVLDLIPGGAPVKKSTSQYSKALLATVRPRDPAGKTRRRMATEELEDLHRTGLQAQSDES